MEDRIKIFTRSFDLKLYSCSKGLYSMLGIPVVRLTDQSADGYFHTMLKDTGCDIAINIDEDAFIVDPDAMMEVVRLVKEGGYANAGCPDGGNGAVPRDGDAAITNPFFNVFNLSLIRSRYDKGKLERRIDDREPYYPFFRWMNSEFRTLYLPAEVHSDGVSTVLKTPQGAPICIHTWFARFYSMPSWMVRFAQRDKGRQKERIDAVIAEAYCRRGLERPDFGIVMKIVFALDKMLRWVIKVPQRVSRWPYKLKKKIVLSRRRR